MTPSDLAVENADLRARLAACERVLLEVIAERDQAVRELECSQPALPFAEAAS